MARILIVNIIITIAAFTVLYFLFDKKQKKLAVADAVELFNKYELKIDLQKHTEYQLRTIQNKLDSIEKLYAVSTNLKNTVEQERLSQLYKITQQQAETFSQKSNQEINEIVWKRLNPLIEEFGKKKDLHLLIGANGMGSVLYKDDYYDLTSELINYANERYENK